MTTEPWSPEWKATQLRQLKSEWSDCAKCPELAECRKKIVMGHGNPDADIVFVGHMIGDQEDKKGKPFVGASGECIDSMLSSLQMSRAPFFFTNLTMCRTPEARAPTKEEKQNCSARLYREIYLVDPILIVALGSDAAQFLIGSRAGSIDKFMGTITEITIPGVRHPLTYDATALYHPAHIISSESPNADGVYRTQGIAQRTFEAMMDAISSVQTLRGAYDKFRRRF